MLNKHLHKQINESNICNRHPTQVNALVFMLEFLEKRPLISGNWVCFKISQKKLYDPLLMDNGQLPEGCEANNKRQVTFNYAK